MSFVLDASVTISWIMADENHPLADIAYGKIRLAYAIAPAIWWYEVRNMLIVNERRGRISISDSNKALQDLERVRIRIDTVQDHGNLLDLARLHSLTIYDAAYLELAIRHRLPIATLDKALQAAAETAGVSLLT